MKGMTLERIAAACGGILHLNETEDSCLKEVSSIVIDSRKAEPGSLFIATKGERVDGHSFIQQVFKAGVLGVVCEKDPMVQEGNYILVKDSFQALKDISKYYLSQLSVKTVGITGSVGKTSTKEMIASVLSQRFCIVKTIGNFNNEVGVPLTVFNIRSNHEIAVIEMGISDFGEMERLSKIVEPDVCVLTNIGHCHLETLGSLDGVLKAKSEIFQHMKKDGFVCINGDDEKLQGIKEVNGKRPVSFGHKEQNDVYVTDIISHGLEGTSCNIHTKEGQISIHIPLPGKHMVDNALAAFAVGLIFSMTLEEIKKGIETVEGLNGRSHLIRTKKFQLVDDCYNANPKAMRAAIDLLSQANGRKIAIIGDMLELGENSDQLHAEVGTYIAQKEVTVILCVGKQAKNIYESMMSLENHKELHYYETREALLEALQKEKILVDGDTILIKASHGMGFDQVVEFLLNY